MVPFEPAANATVNIDVSASSQSVALGGSPRQVRVMNNGTATVWIAFGVSGVTTTATTGLPVPAGAIEVLSVTDRGAPAYVAVIAAAATGRIYFTPGAGV